MGAKINANDSGRVSNPRRFLRLRDVLKRVGVSSATVRRWEKKGTFPQHCQLGPNSVAWVEQEVDDWCAQRSAGPAAD